MCRVVGCVYDFIINVILGKCSMWGWDGKLYIYEIDINIIVDVYNMLGWDGELYIYEIDINVILVVFELCRKYYTYVCISVLEYKLDVE